MAVYTILSLSGGGARGIYQAAFLKALEPTLGHPLRKYFDLIAGTSTGSIVSAGVAFEIDLGQIVDLFEKLTPKVFSARWFSGLRKGPRYSSDPLRKGLDEVFGEKKLGEASTPLLIPATVLDKYTSRQFSTFAEPGVVYISGQAMAAGPDGRFSTVAQPQVEYIDPNLKVADVVMASCAAPSYFSPVRPNNPPGWDDRRSYIDGGMWANSPSLVAVISAHHYLKIRVEDMKVLSLGNGEVALGAEPEKFATMRPLSLSGSMIRSMFDIMFAAQKQGADELVEMLIGEKNLKRINCTLKDPINLDDAHQALRRLPPLAALDAANQVKGIKEFLAPIEQRA